MKLAHDLLRPTSGQPQQTVVFLHGILGTGANLRTLAKRVVEARPEWQALLVDLRNHGDSLQADGIDSVEQCALDVHETASALGLQLDGAVGHSFGGKVALALPNLTHLAVIDSTPGPRRLGRGSESTLEVVQLLEGIDGPWPTREAFVQQIASAGQTVGVARWLAMQLVSKEGQFILGPNIKRVHALLDSYFALDLWGPLEADTGPLTQIVIGDRSPVFDSTERHRVERLVSLRVTAATLDAGHWVHVDAFEPLAKELVHLFGSRLCDVRTARAIDDVYRAITSSLRLGAWGHNLDALNDVLGGGMGVPERFEWRWRGVEQARAALGAQWEALWEVVTQRPELISIIDERDLQGK